MGNADRIIRTIVAVAIALLYNYDVISGTLGIVLLILAGILLLTSFISFCPLYAPFGLSTCSAKRKWLVVTCKLLGCLIISKHGFQLLTLCMSTKITKTQRVISVVLLFFLGFWALLGSSRLLADPTGASLGVPLEYLKDTSFEDYLIPAIVLLLTIGISSILIATTVIRKIKNYPFFIMVQGMLLLFWLTAQLFLNLDFYTPYLHIPFYLIGILLFVLDYSTKFLFYHLHEN